MATYNYLTVVQKVLNRLDDEPVAALDTNDQSEQVAELVNEVRDSLASEYPWPHLHVKGNLVEDSGNQMTLPTAAMNINWIRYDKKVLTYESPELFEHRLDQRDTSLSTVDSNGAYNNKDPQYWTSYDDSTISFDSYDTALAAASAVCSYVAEISALTGATDALGFPTRFHPVLLDGVTAEAFNVLKRDIQQFSIYSRRYRTGVAKLKRWAQRVNQETSTYANDYSRQDGGNLSRVRTVIEA